MERPIPSRKVGRYIARDHCRMSPRVLTGASFVSSGAWLISESCGLNGGGIRTGARVGADGGGNASACVGAGDHANVVENGFRGVGSRVSAPSSSPFLILTRSWKATTAKGAYGFFSFSSALRNRAYGNGGDRGEGWENGSALGCAVSTAAVLQRRHRARLRSRQSGWLQPRQQAWLPNGNRAGLRRRRYRRLRREHGARLERRQRR